MRSQRLAEPPRLVRSVAILAASLCAASLLAGIPWMVRERAKAPEPAPKPPEKERRIRVVRIEKPPPVRIATPQPKPPPAPPKEPPRAAPKPPPPAPRPPPPAMQTAAHPEPAPRPAQPVQVAPDLTSVQGVRTKVYVSTPAELAAHLRNTGGCLVVSNVGTEGAEFVTSLEIHGSGTSDSPAPLCSGAPRTLSPSMNVALGDPLGRIRAEYGPGNYILQAILTPSLYAQAHAVLVARFGPISEEEMGRRAAQTGYELRCFAEPSGVRCE
jgi:hypothetical protein